MNLIPRLILASTSAYRRALLSRLRIPFETVSPEFAEVRLEDPDATVLANARGKAHLVARDRPDAAILGSDQVAFCGGRILEKPGSIPAAIEQLGWMAGREHTLHTCVVLRRPDGTEEEQTVVASLRIRNLSRKQIASYVEIERPLDCAGSYKCEGLGIALFESIRCEDPTAIEGLPLIATCRLLERAGFHPLSAETVHGC